jgi:nitronate monooxygenase
MDQASSFAIRLGIMYPVIQAPMLGVTTPEMVAAIANAGGLGSLPVGGLSPEKTLELIRKTKALTTKPFAVNLFINDVPEYDMEQAVAMQQFLEQMAKENGINYEHQPLSSLHFYSYKEQVQLLLDEHIPIISFTFGIPDDETILAFKSNRVVLMGTATCVKEAKLLEQKQVDYIVAQGIEAGGHRGTFLNDEPLPQVGTIALVSQIIAHVNTPVIAAGGLNDGSTIIAVLTLGAVAAQVGTAFIASDESSAIPAYKEAIQQASDTDSVLTRAFSGRWARGLRNKMMAEIENSNIAIPPYPIHNSLTGKLRAAAQQQNNKDFTNLWAGQSSSNAEQRPAADIFNKMIREMKMFLR